MCDLNRIGRSLWRVFSGVAVSVFVLAGPCAAQVVIYDFESGGDQGFGAQVQ